MSNTESESYATNAQNEEDQPEPLASKLMRVAREEIETIQPRFLMIQVLSSLIPRYSGVRLRARLLRAMGLRIGRGSIIMGTPYMYGVGNIRDRLEIGQRVVLNIGCVFDLHAPIHIEDNVALGHEVMILTSSHHISNSYHRAGPLFAAAVTIKRGAWIGSRSILLPGVTVGEGSVVGAGALVTKDVPPNSLAGGVPAKVIRPLGKEAQK